MPTLKLPDGSARQAPPGSRSRDVADRNFHAQLCFPFDLSCRSCRPCIDLADHACVIETGRVVLTGSAADMKKDDAVRRAYLGY